MAGAPSQLDLFDYKPKLREHDGQPIPEELVEGRALRVHQGHAAAARLAATQFAQARRSRAPRSPSCCRTWRAIVDDIAIVRVDAHDAVQPRAGADLHEHRPPDRRPARAWARGSPTAWQRERETCPAFVVLLSGQNNPDGGTSLLGQRLPADRATRACEFRSKGDPVLFLANPAGVDRDDRAAHSLDVAARPERSSTSTTTGDPEIETRIAAYEMAYRMQSSVPELTDIVARARARPRAVRHRARARPRSPTTACSPGGWSSAACASCSSTTAAGTTTARAPATTSSNRLPELCREIDQAGGGAGRRTSKQRGLLDDTLVVWGGEFGRTPMNEARNSSKFLGRDHHPRCLHDVDGRRRHRSRASTVGETDDLGYNIVEDPVDVHDLHATILHLLGIDHTKLTYRFQGRDFRLTDVAGQRRDEAARMNTTGSGESSPAPGRPRLRGPPRGPRGALPGREPRDRAARDHRPSGPGSPPPRPSSSPSASRASGASPGATAGGTRRAACSWSVR